MNEVAMLSGTEPRKILQAVIEEEVPAIMSYSSNGKWHVAKVLLTNLGANRFYAELAPRQSGARKPHPINIRVDQPVGISLKYRYCKIIFETKVSALEPSPEAISGGTIVFDVPDRIAMVQRRSYFRVEVPASLKVSVLLWHRGYAPTKDQIPPDCYCKGRLVDISAGGLQLAFDASQQPDFKTGQFVGVRFTPMPYETPLMFDAQIRNILPTADNNSICMGLQIVGLEASYEGRNVLSRLVRIVEQYYQITQSNARCRDFQTTTCNMQ